LYAGKEDKITAEVNARGKVEGAHHVPRDQRAFRTTSSITTHLLSLLVLYVEYIAFSIMCIFSRKH
jgi:hypothetical protein